MSHTTSIWKLIYDELVGNAALVAALGHTSSNEKIGRMSNKKHLGDPCVVYSQKLSNKLVDEDQERIISIRKKYIELASFSENNDTIAVDNMELVMSALDGKNLTDGTYKVVLLQWDGFSSAGYYDENEKAYRIDTRFLLITREL